MTAHACPSCGTTTTNHGRCATCAKPENTRKNHRPNRSVYNTPRWRELRLHILIRDRFTCQDCGARANVGAHIHPFTSADDPLAWDERNIKASCARCNNAEAGKRAHEMEPGDGAGRSVEHARGAGLSGELPLHQSNYAGIVG